MKRKIVAVIIGLFLLVIFYFLEYILMFFAGRYFGPTNFGSFIHLINPILKFFSLLSLLLAALITGWVAREKGWLYGGIVGLIPVIGGWVGTIFSYLAPTYVYGPKYKSSPFSFSFLSIIGTFFFDVVTILICALGGWLGERLYHHRLKVKQQAS